MISKILGEFFFRNLDGKIKIIKVKKIITKKILGNDGEVLEGFPIRLGGRVLGKVLLADLISEQTSTLTRLNNFI